MATIFFAVDGDDVGRQLEFFIVMNQMRHLTKFFNDFHSAMIWLEKKLIKDFNANIIFNGGDNLLASFQSDIFSKDIFEELRNNFAKLAKNTLSCGIGSSPRQAYFALKLAKASGKNRIEIFKEYANE